MIIDCISDTHGHYPELEGGDLLIVAGDLTEGDRAFELMQFGDWLHKQSYKKKVVIGGNHDNLLAGGRWKLCTPVEYGWDFDYLCDSGTDFIYSEEIPRLSNDPFNPSATHIKKLKVWGSPWTRTFSGQNPDCMAFALETEEELAKKFALIPKDTDILVTHSPPYGILDQVLDRDLLVNLYYAQIRKKRVGSTALVDCIMEIEPRLCVFGHIHEGYGQYTTKGDSTTYVNASHMNEVYDPVNKPIRIIL